MNLAELRGGVIMRLAPRDKISLAAVDIELTNAADDIRAQARSMGVERLDRVAYINEIANIDIYDYPEEADEIRDIFTLRAGIYPTRMHEISFREQPILDWAMWPYGPTLYPFSWVPIPPRRFRVINKPTQDCENGIMVRFFPGSKKLVKPDDEPNLPRPVHENLIPNAVMRLAGYSDLTLAQPQAFQIYQRALQDRLERFLQEESVSGAANRIQDEDAFYPGGA